MKSTKHLFSYNVVVHRVAHLSPSPLPPKLQHAFSQPPIMEIQTQEARIILAIEAILLSRKLSCCSAAKIYKVLESTLRDRMASRTTRRESSANCHKLTKLEEEVIVQRILDMDTRGFAPWLAGVGDMANFILKSQGGECVGTRWA